MVIGIVHNEPALEGKPFSESSLDVMIQVEAVERACGELGHDAIRIPFTRDLGRFVDAIRGKRVEMLFNLCETVDEDSRLSGHPAAVFELLGIPFTGSPSMALMLTTDKLTTKRMLGASGVLTPGYRVHGNGEPLSDTGLQYPVIVKPRFEDASIGIDQQSIFEDEAALAKGIGELSRRFGAVLIEKYIEGREFNASFVGYPRPEVLPLAEIDFSEFPAGLYHIVSYQAKWDETSFEYQHTPRRFPKNLPPPLLATVEQTALRCFELFMLRDYGRIDMRVDAQDRVYVLEVNANPCLSPDAGFAAAAEVAALPYSGLIARLVSFVVERSGKNVDQADHGWG